MKRRLPVTIAAAFCLLILFITPILADTLYTVKQGDTLFSIARQFNTSVQTLATANGLPNPNLIYVGQVLTIPDVNTTPTPTPPPGSTPTPTPTGNTIYVVRAGDTLGLIAARFGVTIQAIAAANNLANINIIYVGQSLIIPGVTGPGPTATPTPGPTTPPPPPPSGNISYVVQPGDTLGRIALRYGTTVQAIMTANGLTNPNLIYVGQVLTIPVGSGGGGTATPPPPVNTGSFELGGQTHGFGHVSQMQYAGMKWIKFQHKWSPGDDPAGLAGRINDAHANGFKVLISVTGAALFPSPGSIDFASYVSFMGGLAALGPDALEVWNEQNLDREWPTGEISPTSYVNNMLKPAYNAIKQANGNVMVISGAPAPTGYDNGTNAWADNRYVAGLAAAGAASYADCIGVHHNAGATAPGATSGHPGGTHYSWYFGATLNLYYNAFGGSRKVCFTELGYLSGDGFPGLPGAFGWASGTSVAEQAQWLAEATSLSANGGRVRMLIVFNVDFTEYDVNGDPQAGYAIIRPDGSCPACDSLRAVTGG